MVVALFVVINIAAAVTGLLWPKTYTASTTVYVEDRNIIQPLMSGAAVATTATDRAKIAKEILFSRRILAQVLEAGGVEPGVSDMQRERDIESLQKRTRVMNVGGNLVKLEYTDDEPQRAFKTAQKYAELFILEGSEKQTRESTAAFEFIDSQVKEYHEKLTGAEQALKEFRSKNVDARPGTETQITTKISTLQATLEKTSLELKEAKIRQAFVEKQLSGEAAVTASVSREGQYITRIAELQAQLDTLRLSYHDTYPDIVRLVHQIQDLREFVEAEKKKRETAANTRTGDPSAIDESVRTNPIYQRLRNDLLETKTNIEALATRMSETQHMLNIELDRARRVYGGEAALAELTRDYEVNRDIYQDLLRRRENARVSKNLDRDKQGLTMTIQEPASVPVNPSGMRYLHFALGGLMLGLLLPGAIILGLQHVDQRVRLPEVISDKLSVPVLASVRHLVTPEETVQNRRSYQLLTGAVAMTLGFVAMAGLLKAAGLLHL